MPCNVEVVSRTSALVNHILSGNFNLAFISFRLVELDGFQVLTSLAKWQVQVPIVLFMNHVNQNPIQTVQALLRDRMIEESPGVSNLNWTVQQAPYNREKLKQLLQNWWRPLEQHQLLSSRSSFPLARLRDNTGKDLELQRELQQVSVQPPSAKDMLSRSASANMGFPRESGQGSAGMLQWYSSRRFDLFELPEIRQEWERDVERRIESTTSKEEGKQEKEEEKKKKDARPRPRSSPQNLLQQKRTRIQRQHARRLREKAVYLQSQKISSLLPSCSMRQRKISGSRRKAGRLKSTKFFNGACGLTPTHPISGHGMSWDFRINKGADLL